jgi:predicted GIY-YIG superfamily endonuclease
MYLVLIKYEYLCDETNYFGVTKQLNRRLQLNIAHKFVWYNILIGQ